VAAMLTRAKLISKLILAETATPSATLMLSHNLRALLADLAAELIEINQRLDLLENLKGKPDGKI
jgi:hypothetical protein